MSADTIGIIVAVGSTAAFVAYTVYLLRTVPASRKDRRNVTYVTLFMVALMVATITGIAMNGGA